jgi:hypothetical protein
MIYDTPGQRPLPTVTNPNDLLETMMVQAVEESEPKAVKNLRGRPARLGNHLLASGILWCLLHGWISQLDLWRRVSVLGVGHLAPTAVCDQAVYNRLARSGTPLMQELCARITSWLWRWMAQYEDRSLAPFAQAIYALDESTMRGMKRWVKELADLPKGDTALLAGRLVGLFDVRRQQWVRIDWLPKAIANVQAYGKEMLSEVQMGTLLLFDLGYYNFVWFDELTQRGIWWIGRVRQKGSYTIEQWLVLRDGYSEALVWLGAYRDNQSAYLARLVQVRYRGQWYRYITNITTPSELSGAQIVALYARRWDIELGWRTLKDHLGLDRLWSAKMPVIGAQLWSTLILAQLLHALQVQMAVETQVQTFDVSLELLWRYLPDLAQQARTRGLTLAEVLQQDGRALGIIRPSTRIHRRVPEIDQREIAPLRPDLQWIRPPHYAHKVYENAKHGPYKPKSKPGVVDATPTSA